jgi:hypothetical protein
LYKLVLILNEVNLECALLNGANLKGVRGITNEELWDQSSSLEGATMPDGKNYEDWLSDKGGRSEDGEATGLS